MDQAAMLMEYTDARIAALKALLQRKRHKYSMDEYHKIRVEIKKITAVTRLLKFAGNKFKRKSFLRKYKPVFKLAGRIRERQLEEKLLEERGLTESLKNYLHKSHKEVSKEKNAFYQPAAELKKHLKKSGKKMQVATQEIAGDVLKKYLLHLQQQIDALLNISNATYNEVHELRKRLKELYYTVAVFQLPVADIDDLNRLQDLLGSWHDKQVMTEDIAKQNSFKKIKHSESEVLKKFSQDIHADALQLFEALKKITAKFKEAKSYVVTFNAVKTSL